MPAHLRDYQIRRAFPGVTGAEIASAPAAYWDELLAIHSVYREVEDADRGRMDGER